MTAYPAWTPASRPGIIPLHPLTFGTILGRSFAALRHNPRVLLGFAIGVQTVAYLLVLAGIGGVGWATFSRLDTVAPGSDDFSAIMAGSIALTAIAAFVLGLAAGALGVIVQGVVVSEVAHAAVAEKLPLRALWQRLKPVLGRLIGYTVLLSLAVIVLVGIVAVIIVAIGTAALPVAVVLTVLAVIGALPLTLWLSTKLLLVPAAIILERESIRGAIGRSWRLIRGRFWPALGITVIISVMFSAIAQVIGIPFSLITTGLTTVISPTGDPQPSAIIAIVAGGLLTQAVTLAIQSVASVVQATATSLIYIDCRMRREGLDLDLLAYVERRDAGAIGLADPYREHIGREIAPRPPQGYPQAWSPVPAPYGPAGSPPPVPPPYGAYGAYPPYVPAVGPPPAVPAADPPATPSPDRSPTRWTAPGAAHETGPESP